MDVTEIRISVGELVLEGVPVADVAAFRAALLAQLHDRALAHGGSYPGGTAPELYGTPVTVTPHTGPARLAAQVARSVWHSVVPSAPAGGGAS